MSYLFGGLAVIGEVHRRELYGVGVTESAEVGPTEIDRLLGKAQAAGKGSRSRTP